MALGCMHGCRGLIISRKLFCISGSGRVDVAVLVCRVLDVGCCWESRAGCQDVFSRRRRFLSAPGYRKVPKRKGLFVVPMGWKTGGRPKSAREGSS